MPESRELDRLATLLEARGAMVWRCPLVAILDHPDQAAVAAWLRELVAGRFDDLIIFTGEGLRRLLTAAERCGLRGDFLSALGRVRTVTRGPKPARVLTELGLACDVPAAVPTTDGIIATLASMELTPRHVAVQLYGDNPNERLMHFLGPRTAGVHPVHPYIYAPASHDQRVLELIGALAAGAIDAVAFTSATQVQRLWEVATHHGKDAELLAGLQRTAIAAVGPVVAQALADHGAPVRILPGRNYFLKPLVEQMAQALHA